MAVDSVAQTREIIVAGAEQIKEAVSPSGVIKEAEKKTFVEARPQQEVLERVVDNKALTPVEVKAFLDNSTKEIAVLEKLPESVKFSIEQGDDGKERRKKQLVAILEKIGIKTIGEGDQELKLDEVWDAAIYDFRKKEAGGAWKTNWLLQDDRGNKIKNISPEVFSEIGEENIAIVLSLASGIIDEGIDPLSLTSGNLLQPFKNTLFELHKKQKISNPAEVVVKDVLVTRKKLQRWEIVNNFFNQRAEGRSGQKESPELGESQLPDGIGFDSEKKEFLVLGLPYSGDPYHLTVIECLNVLEETDRMFIELEDQLQNGVQGRRGWMAEAILRRLDQIWSETSKDTQKAVGEIMTWTSVLGRGHWIAEMLLIPGVGEILSMPDLYQQRKANTDKPEEMVSLPKIEKELKKKAKAKGISTSKVDLAIKLARILQISYDIGRVGIKHRTLPARYGFADLAAGLPIGTIPETDLEGMDQGERRVLEAQIMELQATMAGNMKDYMVEHLGRIVDNAATEDALYIRIVGEPPVYEMPSDELIAIFDKAQKVDEKEGVIDKLKSWFNWSYLHREQIRWLFVTARFGGFYKDWEHGVGESATEFPVLNPHSPKDRRVLRERLFANEFSAKTLKEAGIKKEWITDEVIVEVFSDENMIRVNDFRKQVFDTEGRNVLLTDLTSDVKKVGALFDNDEVRKRVLAMALEFVLRAKRTWGVDMGEKNNLLGTEQLSQLIREGGFAADEFGMITTMEHNRKNIHATYVEILKQMRLAKLNNEFPNVKAYLETVTEKYTDDPRFRGDSLAGPFIALETALSIRAGKMMADYILLGYEETLHPFTDSQKNLYDKFDFNRILHERFHPIVGAAQRIYGRGKYLDEVKKILKRHRAVPSVALDIAKERQFMSSPSGGEIIKLLMRSGFAMYDHAVARIGEFGEPVGGDGKIGEIILDTHPDYWRVRYEREAQKLYEPASRLTSKNWESAAENGEMNRDKARAQIDQNVAIGFMRRWYDNERNPIGLGDLFQTSFETYIDYQDPKKGKRLEIFPINFMISLQREAYSVSIEWAMANDYPNPVAFWHEAKGRDPKIEKMQEELEKLNETNTGYEEKKRELEGLRGYKAFKLWREFRKKMLVDWMINVELPDSEIPTYYWEWRDSCLEMLGLTEERVEQLEEGGLWSTTFKLKQKLSAINKLIGRESWNHKILREEEPNFRKRLETDPIRKELVRVEERYGKWIVKEVSDELDRAHKHKGLSAANKVRLREAIVDHYNKGHIDRNTRDALLSKVVETRYGNGLVATAKDWKNFIVNGEINLSLYDWGFEAGVGLLGMAIKDLKKALWYDVGRAILIPSPLGWVVGGVYTGAVGSLSKAAFLGTQYISIPWLHSFFSFIPSSLSLPFSVAGIVGAWLTTQNSALVTTWITRLINSKIFPWFTGRRFADNEAIIRRLESSK